MSDTPKMACAGLAGLLSRFKRAYIVRNYSTDPRWSKPKYLRHMFADPTLWAAALLPVLRPCLPWI